MTNLQNLQNKLSGFWSDKPIKKAYLFGSAARQEMLPDSDIDILVELDQSKLIGMIEYIKIIEALENLLERKVDLVTTDGLSPYIKPTIDREKLLIYEE
ncbi:MAG: nucleotidyltransferase domain-containing protein [Dyadobacter sp.]|uniref:nucleotidyltransferase family protein n=1 Tax=Dyadobacter sp. 3J3 TaxID=2606600 RepID=UPI00135AAFD1|nr:nucleotidyltransferase domain-containing protein [Dyadobacter sp. 3J3]